MKLMRARVNRALEVFISSRNKTSRDSIGMRTGAARRRTLTALASRPDPKRSIGVVIEK